MTDLDPERRYELARQYAAGELSLQELRAAGHVSTITLLSDLDTLGLRLPLAEMVGPNVETRQAGMARLAAVLQR